MGSDQGASEGAVSHLDRLASDPRRFHVFHALRVLEAHYADAPRMGKSRRPMEDPVRLGQNAEMAFPRSALDGFEPAKGGKPARLTNLFFGLFGPHGPLPLHLTAYARDRARNHRDRTLLEFANMFTHRMMGLFYRAWSSAEPAPSFDRPGEDAFADKVAALAGYRGEAFEKRDAMPDTAKRYFAGHLANGTRHADGLASIVGAVFGTEAVVHQFVGSWNRLEPTDRWSLGAGSPSRNGLGRSFHIGEQVWSRSTRFALAIGPLGMDDYKGLLPGQPGFSKLTSIVRNYVGDAMDFDVALVLKGTEVPQPLLGSGLALGHSLWIGQRQSAEDAADLRIAGS